MSLIDASRALCTAVDALSFGAPAAYTYNPLAYAHEAHELFLARYGDGRAPGRVLLVGMNPGPFGMGQTGVPFGDIVAAKEWMGLYAKVEQPPTWHPKRPILGYESTRREGSGKRLWGWAEERWGSADAFFDDFFVHNYCPLWFTEGSGRNLIPEKLKKAERVPLLAACDQALRDVVTAVNPRAIVGVGKFAEKRAHAVFSDSASSVGDVPIHCILHPSPANPRANKNWIGEVEPVLRGLGVRIPGAS